MKIVTIIGARPQFVKAAAVSRCISKFKYFSEYIIHTGQHFDGNMSDIFFEQMHIPRPNIHLNINCLDHGAMTGRMLESIETVLKEERPDWVLVYGDTNSTLAGALAAAKLHIPIAHVEAGLRSFNRRMPEEINRILSDQLSTLLFCPTQRAVENLAKEGVGGAGEARKVLLVGDVMLDAALYYRQFAERPRELRGRADFADFVLATLHRAENTDDPKRLGSIMDALREISSSIPVVFPVHPRTRKRLEQFKVQGSFSNSPGLLMIEPVGYLGMVWLLERCGVVLTDSGGLQKEAFFFGKPCITLRDETEWVELVENGYNVIVGSDRLKIMEAMETMRNKRLDFGLNLYGEGKTACKIVEELFKSNPEG